MFDKERFHNEIAIRLGYERIVKDKRITILIEESEMPCVTLKIQGYYDLKFNVSKPNDISIGSLPEMSDEIKDIVDIVHQAYIESCNRPF